MYSYERYDKNKHINKNKLDHISRISLRVRRL